MVSQGAARGQLLHQASTQYLETFFFRSQHKEFRRVQQRPTFSLAELDIRRNLRGSASIAGDERVPGYRF